MYKPSESVGWCHNYAENVLYLGLDWQHNYGHTFWWGESIQTGYYWSWSYFLFDILMFL